MLYVPQVFLLKERILYGGYSYTRRYFCRIFDYKDGGQFMEDRNENGE